MADGIADYAVDASAAIELMRAVEMFEVVEADLAGSRRGADRGVFKGAAMLEREDASREADFAHRHGDAVFGSFGPLQKADAVGDGSRKCGDLDRVYLTADGHPKGATYVGGSLEVVDREHNAAGHGVTSGRFVGKLAERFDFNVAPLAAGFASLDEPIELGLDIAWEETTGAFTAASR